MSSAPKSSIPKFSFSDLKSSLIKKEDSTGTPSKKSARVPLTRHKKRTLEPSINVESDEDPTMEETRNKLLSGVNQMFHLAQKSAEHARAEMANELAAANEKIQDLIKIAAHREADSQTRERQWKKECEDIMEQAKGCATTAVAEAMYHMAENAASDGYCHKSWDLESWAMMLDKPVIKVAAREVGEQAGAEGAAGAEVGEAAGDKVGDEGDLTAGAH